MHKALLIILTPTTTPTTMPAMAPPEIPEDEPESPPPPAPFPFKFAPANEFVKFQLSTSMIKKSCWTPPLLPPKRMNRLELSKMANYPSNELRMLS